MTALSDNLFFGQFDSQTDIGQTGQPGSSEYDAKQQAYSLCGSGANIWGEQDAFHFVWKRISGNFILTARAAFIGEGTNPHRKIGWMARADLTAGSAHASAALHGDGLVSLQFRRTPAGSTEEVQAALAGADVLQLERKGNSFSMSAARYGQPFTTVEAAEIDLGETVYVGLFICSHQAETAERASFRDVRIVVPVREGFERGQDPCGSHLEILDLANGGRSIVYSSESIFEAPNWTRDGKALVYNADGRLIRFDLASGRRRIINTAGIILNNNDHVLSFDGSMLAISSHSPTDRLSRVFTVPLKGGQPKLITPLGPSYLHGWSPDGRFLVYTAMRNGQYDIYRIPAEGGEEIQLTDSPGLDDGPEYTPDGCFIYFNSIRSGSMQIWRMQPDGTGLEQLTEDEYNNWFPHVSPDGKSVVFISYLPGETEAGDHPPAKRVYLRLMPLNGGVPKVVAYLYGGQGTMNVPSWSPDGSRLAFVSNTVPYR